MSDKNHIKELKARWKTEKGYEIRNKIIKRIKKGVGSFDILKNLPYTDEVPEGYQDFRGINLKREKLAGITRICLPRTSFNYSNLYKAELKNGNYQDSYFISADIIYAEFMNSDFVGAKLKKAILKFTNLQGSDLRRANFTDANIFRTDFKNCEVNEETDFGDKVLHEQRKHYKEAEEIYRNLKSLFHSNGLYERAGKYYYRESFCKTRWLKEQIHNTIQFWKKLRLWFSWFYRKAILEWIIGYGERPRNILITWLITLLVSTIIYWVIGIRVDNAETMNIFSDFIDSLSKSAFLSITTFTALGYGNITPLGFGKTWVIIEAILGYFILALFLVVFIRKAIRYQ